HGPLIAQKELVGETLALERIDVPKKPLALRDRRDASNEVEVDPANEGLIARDGGGLDPALGPGALDQEIDDDARANASWRRKGRRRRRFARRGGLERSIRLALRHRLRIEALDPAAKERDLLVGQRIAFRRHALLGIGRDEADEEARVGIARDDRGAAPSPGEDRLGRRAVAAALANGSPVAPRAALAQEVADVRLPERTRRIGGDA